MPLDPMQRAREYLSRRRGDTEERLRVRRSLVSSDPSVYLNPTGFDLATKAEIVQSLPEATADQVGNLVYVENAGTDDILNIAVTDGDGTPYWVPITLRGAETYAEQLQYNSQFGTLGSGNGQFDRPNGISIDSTGDVYVADITNYRIQKLSSAGVYEAKVGSSGTGSSQFSSVVDTATDGTFVYTIDQGMDRVQKFTIGATSLTYSAQFGSSGSGTAQFSGPSGIAHSGTSLYIADTLNHRIKKISTALAYQAHYGSYGTGNGQFILPRDVAIDSSGNIWVADSGNHRIQKLNSSGTYQLKFGSYGSGEGQFNQPWGIAIDSADNIYVADRGNNRIQKFDSSGNFVLAFGSYGTGNGQFKDPRKLAIYETGGTTYIYVADTNNNRILVLEPQTVTIGPTGASVYRSHIMFFSRDNSNAIDNEWTNMPSTAGTELFGGDNRRAIADLTSATQARLIVNVTQGGATGAKLYVQYSTNNSSWNTFTTTTGVAIDATGIYAESFTNIVAGAKIATCYLRVVGSGGNATADPRFGNIYIEVK